MTNITIHANPTVPWQKRLAPIVAKGLQKHNIKPYITPNHHYLPKTDISIILGPNYWKPIEQSGHPFIMMNRKFLGFHERDVHDNVAISWDGFNGRGTFCVDEPDPERFRKYIKDEEFEDWKKPGTDYLLFKQTDLGRCKDYPSINEWYIYVKRNIKPLRLRQKMNPEDRSMSAFRKKFRHDLKNVKAAIILNSTASSEILLYGIPVISMDEGDPCYAINSHTLDEKIKYPNRLKFFQYLAMCQHHYSEIENGDFWPKIFPKRGTRLCEWKS